MTELEEETVSSLKTLFAKVNELQNINIRDILKPDIYNRYEKTLQTAYDALTQIERTINSLGMKLKYQHWRLSDAIEELKPFFRQPSQSDEVNTL